MMRIPAGTLLRSPEEAWAAVSPSIAVLVVTNCGYPLLLTSDYDGEIIAKSPGDTYLVTEEDECCFPYAVVWA